MDVYMPKSDKPRRPFKGNKYLLNSKEFAELQRQNIEMARQLRSVQALVISLTDSLYKFASTSDVHPPQGEVSVPGDDPSHFLEPSGLNDLSFNNT